MGTHPARIDAKGRLSIPAPFRTVLRSQSEGGVAAMVLLPSAVAPCLEGYSLTGYGALTAKLEQMDPFSPEYDALAFTLYSKALPTEADKEGRIVVPDSMVAHAALTDGVLFMGLGRKFQIWQPDAGRAQQSSAESERAARYGRAGAAP